MANAENPLTGLQSSRCNLIRIGAIVASAVIAKTTSELPANMMTMMMTLTVTGTNMFIVF